MSQPLIGPYSPGGGLGQSLIPNPPFSVDQLLDVVRRTTPPSFWQTLFAGNGLAGWNGVAATLARASLAVNNADLQSYVLTATSGTPATGSITVQATGTVPSPIPIQAGTVVSYQPGAGAGTSYFVVLAPVTLPAGINTVVVIRVASMVDGYQTGLPLGATSNAATGVSLIFGVNAPTQFQSTTIANAVVPVVLTAGSFVAGTPDALGALGASRGVYQGSTESTAAYRRRIRSPKLTITPPGVLNAVNAALSAFGPYTATLQEEFGVPYPPTTNPGYIPPPQGLILTPRGGFYDGSILVNTQFVNTTIAAPVSSGLQTVTPGSMSDIGHGTSLWINGLPQPGTGYPVPADQELVLVTATTATTFTAIFSKNHAAGAAVQGGPTPWFYDQGQGPGLSGTTSAGPLMDDYFSAFFVVTIPWIGGNPGLGFTFSDVYPFPPQGFFDQSFSDGALSSTLTWQAAAAVYAAIVGAKAAGVGFILEIADIA